jgi:hypothetical protein
MQPMSLRFAAASRTLGILARRDGLIAPTFRSPPGRADSVRTIRRTRADRVTISIALRDRPWTAVLADMIEGVVVANELAPSAAEAWRDAAWGRSKTIRGLRLLESRCAGHPVPRAAPSRSTASPSRPRTPTCTWSSARVRRAQVPTTGKPRPPRSATGASRPVATCSVFDIADGSHYIGEAIVRFSDGARHLFRGDGELSGFDES